MSGTAPSRSEARAGSRTPSRTRPGGVLEEVRAIEEDLRIGPHRHADEGVVDLRLFDQRREEICLDLVGEHVVQRLDAVREASQPDGVESGDVERHRARRELSREAVVQSVVGQLHERDLGAGLLGERLRHRLELGLAAALHQDRDRLAPLARGVVPAGPEGNEAAVIISAVAAALPVRPSLDRSAAPGSSCPIALPYLCARGGCLNV